MSSEVETRCPGPGPSTSLGTNGAGKSRLGRNAFGRARPRLQKRMHLRRHVAPVADRPDDERSAAHDVARREDSLKRSEEHTSELQSLMRISYAVFCLKKKKHTTK